MNSREFKNKIITMSKDINDTFKKNESMNSLPFNSLSPIDNAEDCEIYFDALEWALTNKNKNRNIAISGSYGSGKSSIIQTFIKKSQSSSNLWRKLFPKYRFFNISLATFKETQDNGNDNNAELQQKGSDNNPELQRLIELSILQQLFFHEEDSNIPDSRFKKIKQHKRFKLIGYSILTIVITICILFIISPDFLAKFSIINFDKKYLPYLNKIASIITLLGLFLLIYKMSRSLIGFSIKKLKINDAEIEIEKGISTSILNNHLDEIIYFFEATKYNVVVIEDLDRFAQAEVYTKLREINLLINNSKKVKQHVVFIYAIKDDMFLDKNRAKFFDFIIPIIPVINSSNSGAKLRKIVEKNNYILDDELLDDLSMFIDDMRLLYNIMNEFYIYSKKINNNLNMNQLLSIIVYKNIFPNDFTKLNDNKGDLFQTISKKRGYIKSSIIELDKQITELKNEIKRIEEHELNDIKELRTIYIAKVVEKIKKGFLNFNVNNNQISLSDFTSDDNFSKLKKGKIDYYYIYSNYNAPQPDTINISFNDIEKEVNPLINYSEREKLIHDKTRTNDIKKEIERINERKYQIQKSNLKDLLQNKNIVAETIIDKKSDLINILLRNGYIDENYMDYISVFHEGELTKSDYEFLIGIKTEKVTEFDYKLNKTEELIKKINEYAFEKEFVLNYDLVDTLLKNNNFATRKDHFFKQLSNEKEKIFSFIDEYIDRTAYIELFVKELCKYWSNIWRYINSKIIISDEKKNKYFNLIIQYAEIKNIVEIFKKDSKSIYNYPSFLKINTDKERLISVIKDLHIKFNTIEIDSPESLLHYIFENNHYSLNPEMIKSYSSIKNVYNEKLFQTKNYSFIYSTKLQKMIDYIESNIEEYVEFVFLKLENNTEEQLDFYIDLLNKTELSIELKEKVIIKSNTIIDNIDTITDNVVRKILLMHLKINPKWDNVLIMFEENTNVLSDAVIEFINNVQIAEILSSIKMKSDKNDKGIQIYSKLCEALLNNRNIITKSLELISKSIPWWYESFETDNLSKERITILIENNKVNPTLNSFNYLQENFKGTNILLIEKHFSKFKDLIEELIIDSEDLSLILKSNIIDTKSKFDFINKLDDAIILENAENIDSLTKYLIEFDTYSISNSLKIKLLVNNNLTTKERITFFNKNKSILTKELITNFLLSLGSQYELITDTSKKAQVDDNVYNRLLFNILIELNYISSFSEKDKVLRVNHKRQE